MNKKEAQVTIALKYSVACKFEYDTLEDLASSVNEFLALEEESFNPASIPEGACIRLPECDGGGTYKWNATLARYCFGEGHISETRMVEELFCEENTL
jgi:hypothetical protein